MAAPIGNRSEIVFFDLEAPETEPGNYVIVEFGAILVDSKTLQVVEGRSYSTFVQPANPTHISSFDDRSNGITKEALASAPTFEEIADEVYDRLHGRIWAGHNIEECDCDLIREAFEEIDRVPPKPKGTFDSVQLLRSQRFERVAGDNRMDSVAAFFGLGKQKHRSLEDVLMNIEVLKCCATLHFLKMAVLTEDRSEIVFFDLKNAQTQQGSVIVEFGAMLLDPKTLVLHRSFSTLVQPADPTHINSFVDRRNGITKEALASAPTFARIADHIYDLLHGRIWDNIERRDCDLIREAFEEIGRVPPEPKGTFDSVQLLRSQGFGSRAGEIKMDRVAAFFGLGKQKHRSLDDVRMNIEVLKCCATVFLMESTRPDLFLTLDFLKPDDIFIRSIYVTLEPIEFVNDSGRQQLHFMVDAPSELCKILDTCDDHADKVFLRSGGSSEWHRVVIKTKDFHPTLRLRLSTVKDGDITHLNTKIYQKRSMGFFEQIRRYA